MYNVAAATRNATIARQSVRPAEPYQLQNLLALAYVIERERRRSAEEQLSRTAQDFSAVLKVLRRIVERSIPLDDVLPFVAERLLEITGAEGAAIALRKESADIICVARAGRMAPALGTRVDPARGISGECVRLGRPVACADTATDARVTAAACLAGHISSVLVVPIAAPDGVLGLVETLSGRRAAFEDRDLDILEAVAALLALVVGAQKSAKPVAAELEAAMELLETAETATTMAGAEPQEERTAPAAATVAVAELQAEEEPAHAIAIAVHQDRRSRTVAYHWLLGAVAAIVIGAVVLGGVNASRNFRHSQPQPLTPPPAPSEVAKVAPAAPATVSPLLPEIASLAAVKYSFKPGFTAIAVELDRPVPVRAYRLTDPERLYFDLSGTRIAQPLLASTERTKTIAVGDAVVKRIRLAQYSADTARVVVDLARRCDFTFVMSDGPPYRLVIDIETPRAGATTSHLKADKLPALTPVKVNAEVLRPQRQQIFGRKLRIVIDPGHGGQDLGTVGPGGMVEKDVVLDIARRLGHLLALRLNAEIIYTRTDDRFVSLEARAAAANLAEADLLVSIHGNSSPEPSARGVETFYFEGATGQAQLQPSVLQEVKSRLLAADIQRALSSGQAKRFDRGVKKAAFVVLSGLNMPAVLTEVAFLSSPKDEHNLTQAEGRNRIAESIGRGVVAYVRSQSREPVPIAAAGQQ